MFLSLLEFEDHNRILYGQTSPISVLGASKMRRTVLVAIFQNYVNRFSTL